MLLMRRFGTKLVVAGGLASMSAGFAVAATTTVNASYWGTVIVAMVLGVRYSLLFASETAYANTRYHKDAGDLGVHLHQTLLPVLAAPDRAAAPPTF